MTLGCCADADEAVRATKALIEKAIAEGIVERPRVTRTGARGEFVLLTTTYGSLKLTPDDANQLADTLRYYASQVTQQRST